MSRNMFRGLSFLILLAAVSANAVSHGLVAPSHLNSVPRAEQLLILQNMFSNFKTEFSKIYDSREEEETRFQTFENNMRIAAKLNVENPQAQFGASFLADLSPAEFQEHYLARLPSETTISYDLEDASATVASLEAQRAPAEFDLEEQGLLAPVRSQGSCGCCWAMSMSNSIEGAVSRRLNRPVQLSVQQLLDCTGPGQDCAGGEPLKAAKYASQVGLVAESDYPFVGAKSRCSSVSIDPRVAHPGKVSVFSRIPGLPDLMKAAIYGLGPLTVEIDATLWQLYLGGTMTSGCWTGRYTHGVTVVGYGFDDHGTAYWKLRNSWGPKWGMKGYMRVGQAGNMCGIYDKVTSVAVA